MKSLIVFCCLLIISVAVEEDSEWEAFKTRFNKKYDNPFEEPYRKQIFLNNKMIIEKHNRLFDAGNVTFTMGINRFSDMSSKEYVARLSAYTMSPFDPSTPTHQNTKTESTPLAVDWRKKKCVTRVKDQGHCGSCWAFSAVGSVESIQCIRTGKLMALSEQELLDCSEGAGGCRGGWNNKAFQYIIDNKGISREGAYPYTAKAAECKRSAGQIGATIRSYVNVAEGKENDLRNAVAQQPVSVEVDGSLPSFGQYKKGIYYDSECSSTDFSHAMLVVGYGSYRGRDYWIVKNSWGTDWGEKGYMKMARNRGNNCGIATRASYPIY